MKKHLLPLLFLFISLPLFAENEEAPAPQPLAIGDSAGKVKEIMGEPNGSMQSGDFAIYYYKLGTVKMKSGQVSTLELISEEEWQRQQQAKQEAREARRIKGEAVLAKVSTDPVFAQLPSENRLAFWEEFREKYPDVDVFILYSQAKIEVEKQQEKQKEEQRIANLERRVERAEIEAKRAADAAETQRIYSQNRYYTSPYPQVIVYPQSYITGKPHSHRTQNGHSSGNRLSVNAPGLSFTVGGNYRKQRSTTTHGSVVNTQNGVSSIRSSEGFIRDFY